MPRVLPGRHKLDHEPDHKTQIEIIVRLCHFPHTTAR